MPLHKTGCEQSQQTNVYSITIGTLDERAGPAQGWGGIHKCVIS
jgi:hypothetical protein